MYANELAIGRNHYTADRATLTAFVNNSNDDCYRTNLYWNDGAEVYELFDTEEEAKNNLRRLGWNA